MTWCQRFLGGGAKHFDLYKKRNILTQILCFKKERAEGVSVALQRVEVATILCWAVVVAGEACFRLGVLPGFSLVSLHDLLRATGDGFRS